MTAQVETDGRRNGGLVSEIVVGVDGSPESDEALIWALRHGRSRDIAVRAVHVWSPSGNPREIERLAAMQSVTDLRDNLLQDVIAGVDATVREVGAPDVEVSCQVLHGHVVRTLVGETSAGTLLVVGSRGHGSITGPMLGSVSQSCVQYATGTVIVVRGHHSTAPKRRVVAGVDGSPSSVRALRFADEAARLSGATLLAVHAWSLPYAGFAGRGRAFSPTDQDGIAARAGDVLRDSLRSAGVDPARPDVEMWLAEGTPVLSLLQAADNADLLVLGSRGYGGWKGMLLGSVSGQCVTRSPCPVAVIRDQDDTPR